MGPLFICARPPLRPVSGGLPMATKSWYARNGSRRRKLRARLKAMRLPCAICGGPIDYDLPAGDPMSFEVDEIVPVSLGGSELDWTNLQPAHRVCNQRKGNKIGFTAEPCSSKKGSEPPKVRASRDWTK